MSNLISKILALIYLFKCDPSKNPSGFDVFSH